MLKLPFAPQNVAVFGIAKDKDALEVIKLCADKFDKWFIAKTNTDRGIDTNSIAKMLIDQGVNSQKIVKCDSIAMAYQNASKIENARIICFGSFLVVEEAHKMIEQLRR